MEHRGMKKIAWFVLALLLCVAGFGQNTKITVDRLEVKQSMKLVDKTVTSISQDSSFGSATHAQLPTAQAVKKFVDSSILNIDSLMKAATASGFLTANSIPYVDANGRLDARGFEEFGALGSAPSAPSGGFRLYGDVSGRPSWRRADGYVRTFDAAAITGDRVYTLQDASGTLAMLGVAQTWTGVQTFAPSGSGGSGFTVQGTARFSMPVPVATDAQISALTGNVLGGWMVSSTQSRPYFYNGSSYLGVMLGPQGGVPAGRVSHGDASGNMAADINLRWENNRLLIGNPTYNSTQPWGLGVSSVIRSPNGYSLQSLGEGHDGFYGMRSGGTNVIALGIGGNNVFAVRATGGTVDHTTTIDRSANPGPLASPMYSLVDRTTVSITNTSVAAPFVSFGATISLSPSLGQTYRQNYTYNAGSVTGRSTGTLKGYTFTPSSFATEVVLLEGFGKVLVNGSNAQIGIGTGTPNASSAIQIEQTNAGFVPARVTTAQRNAIGVGVSAVSVGAGGTGYAQPPVVVFSGGDGSGATAYSTISGGAVTSIVIVNSGSGYTSAPTVSFNTEGGPGSGATATATLSSPVRSNGLSVLNTDLNRYEYWSTALGAWMTEASFSDIKRDTTYKVVNANLDLSAQTTFFKNNYHTVRVATIVTAAATGNNTITMPVPTVDLLGINFKISIEDTSGDGDISVLSFGTDGADGYLYNGDGTYASSQNLFPGIGVYLSVAWCEAKSAYRWVLQ